MAQITGDNIFQSMRELFDQLMFLLDGWKIAAIGTG